MRRTARETGTGSAYAEVGLQGERGHERTREGSVDRDVLVCFPGGVQVGLGGEVEHDIGSAHPSRGAPVSADAVLRADASTLCPSRAREPTRAWPMTRSLP